MMNVYDDIFMPYQTWDPCYYDEIYNHSQDLTTENVYRS